MCSSGDEFSQLGSNPVQCAFGDKAGCLVYVHTACVHVVIWYCNTNAMCLSDLFDLALMACLLLRFNERSLSFYLRQS